ncbi:MAG TPA: outer membrane beta-barrel protein [Blastocatellia bacterium]|jgi:outer membrane immunogenic protein|nr:outer membrane beta-barrel protein [Blastocatellia bacterium]
MPGKIAKVLRASVLTSSLLGMCAVASAADMPVKAPPAPQPAPPLFSWTGFYIGGNLGVAWSDRTMTDTVFGIDFTGNDGNRARFMGGGQVGINYQINNFVIGVEADFDGVANNDNNSGGRVIAGDTIRVNSNDTWIATVAGRIGYAWDRVLFYGKGGGGWIGNSGFTVTDVTTGASFTTSNNNTISGWLAGGGIEWAFADNWSARVEYDFLGLSDRTLTVPLGVPVIGGDVFTLHDRNVQMVTFGVNYRFNWFSPSNTVATRY